MQRKIELYCSILTLMLQVILQGAPLTAIKFFFNSVYLSQYICVKWDASSYLLLRIKSAAV